MSPNPSAPGINDRCICIVDRDSVALAAVISSYLFEPGRYVPLFLFPAVEFPRTDEDSPMGDSYMSNLMGGEAAILINNAWARMGGSEYLILAGLSEHQKSYLLLPEGTKVIEIGKVSEIEVKLSPLGLSRRGELRCKAPDVLKGLFLAQKYKKTLAIDDGADDIPEQITLRKGIVVMEKVADASPVIAVNYASSVDANIMVVEPLPEHEGRNVPMWIQDWKESGDDNGLQKLREVVSLRIGDTSFAEFEYATFFTEGLPYSFILENAIPCSYVHLSLKPDLFVINNIIFEHVRPFHAAVVFSPTFFADEETSWLCDFFSRNNQYVRALLGPEATLSNFDFHVQSFPYGLLHICSHGGEVEGYEMLDRFVDRDGSPHTVEFDEVVGFTPVPDKEGLVEVHRKAFPRKLDGFAWMSRELDEQNFPSHVYTDMWKCVLKSRGRRTIKGRVPMSCSIACVDSIHQGQFNTLASHSSPLVFNNACWSWYEVAKFFLACGARGYLGTLWAINNQAAVIAAQAFYTNAFSEPVLVAVHKAIKVLDETDSKDIYIYWGLHFSTFPRGRSPQENYQQLAGELMRAAARWASHIESTKSAELKRYSIRVLDAILRELLINFAGSEVQRFVSKVRGRVPETARIDIPRGEEENPTARRRSFVDFPTERREK